MGDKNECGWGAGSRGTHTGEVRSLRVDSFPQSRLGAGPPRAGLPVSSSIGLGGGARWMEDKMLPSIESHFFVLVQKSPNPTVV